MYTIRESVRRINLSRKPRLDEPMSEHTSFRLGGPADVFFQPNNVEEVRRVVMMCRDEQIPWMALGAGANILVSDRGIRGAVIDLALLQGIHIQGRDVTAWAGCEMSALAKATADGGLSGLDSFYGMPGHVGGSIWMNARCYERSISDVLTWVDELTPQGDVQRREVSPEAFRYKYSPFQDTKAVILRAGFGLDRGDVATLRSRMRQHKTDRTLKGHYLFPCAGSIFRNNRSFGAPSGQIIDRVGFRGRRRGGALVSDLHANIIVNTGGATAKDVLDLILEIERQVHQELGFRLERELLLVGDWEEYPHGYTGRNP